MFLQSIKFSGLVAIVAAGAFGTMVVAQQAKKAADSGRRTDRAAVSTVDEGATESQTALREKMIQAHVQFKLDQDERAVLQQQEWQKLRQLADKKTQLINQKLDQVIDAEFPGGTTVEQFLKHIKRATTDAKFPGIPIYVDPIGLLEAKHTMDSAIEVNRKNCSVRELLKSGLHPLQLSYFVNDGFLTINSRTSVTEMRLEELERKLDRVLESMERLAGQGK